MCLSFELCAWKCSSGKEKDAEQGSERRWLLMFRNVGVVGPGGPGGPDGPGSLRQMISLWAWVFVD